MKSRILSFCGIGAIALAVACNSSNDESTNKDSLSTSTTTTTTTADNGGTSGSASADIQTSADGKRYIVRHRGGSSTSASGGQTSGTTASGSSGNDYDTVWLYTGSDNRYYTMHGRDTLYYNTDQWNSWWNDSKTDDEFKSKSGDTKVKVDKDGSWKVKDKDEKTKMNDKGEVKTKPKG